MPHPYNFFSDLRPRFNHQMPPLRYVAYESHAQYGKSA